MVIQLLRKACLARFGAQSSQLLICNVHFNIVIYLLRSTRPLYAIEAYISITFGEVALAYVPRTAHSETPDQNSWALQLFFRARPRVGNVTQTSPLHGPVKN